MVTKISDKTSNDVIPSAEYNWIVDLTDGTGVANARLAWAQTDTTGYALNVSRNLASTSTDSPVVYLHQDNASDDQTVLSVKQYGTTNAVYIEALNDTSAISAGVFTDTTTTGSGKNYVSIATTTDANRRTVWIYRNLSSANTGGAVVTITQDNSGDDQAALYIVQDGTAYGANISITNTSATNPGFNVGRSDGYETVGLIRNRADGGGNGTNLFYRNLASTDTTGAVVKINQANASDDMQALRIEQACTTVEAIKLGTGSIAIDFATAMATTGAGTMAVNNSPGAGATTWIKCEVNGTTGYIPFHYAA